MKGSHTRNRDLQYAVIPAKRIGQPRLEASMKPALSTIAEPQRAAAPALRRQLPRHLRDPEAGR